MAVPCDNLDAEQLALLAPVLAISLARNRSSNEIEMLSDFMTSVADLLSLLASKEKAAVEKSKAKTE